MTADTQALCVADQLLPSVLAAPLVNTKKMSTGVCRRSRCTDGRSVSGDEQCVHGRAYRQN
jgi:hypothetical protein